MILYRVVSKDIFKEITNRKRAPFIEHGFMSTALSVEGIKKIETSYLLKIYLNYDISKNIHGIYVNEYAKEKDESELLLMPNLRVRLLSKPYFDIILRKKVCKVTVYSTQDANK